MRAGSEAADTRIVAKVGVLVVHLRFFSQRLRHLVFLSNQSNVVRLDEMARRRLASGEKG
jgi:hypothetical protein